MKVMIVQVLVIMMLLSVVSCRDRQKDILKEPVDYVDPLIGSVARTKYYGRTIPGVSLPFSLVKLSPDTYTGGDIGSGYSYEHNTLEGFSFVHMSGVGWFGEFGNLLVTPTNGPFHPNRGSVEQPETGYRSSFSHDTEVAEAGYYAVVMDDYNIEVELTASQRSGMLRFTFPEDTSNRIQIDLARRIGGTSLKQYIRVVDDQTIEGWMYCAPEGGGWGNGKPKEVKYTFYFCGKFSKPFDSYGIWSALIPDSQSRKVEDIVTEEYQELIRQSKIYEDKRDMEGKHLGFYANYPDLLAGEQILFKAGVSFVDMEGARKNLEAEVDHWDFDRERQDALQAWSSALSKIVIKGATEDQKTIFYTGLYRALSDPRRFNDVDGRYYGGDYGVHEGKDFTYRTIFSGWDAFRSHIPLLSIIEPHTVDELVRSLMDKAKLGGKGLPKWEIAGCYSGCMLGDPAIPVILDAYRKGIGNFNVHEAYEYCRQTSLGPETTRNGWLDYNEVGYVACDPVPERWNGYYKGVSATLENCYADWCISELARELGKKEDAELFGRRSKFYKNIYDDSTGYMRGKYRNGAWIPWEGRLGFKQACIESNPLQQSWFVPHDIPGFKELFGAQRFTDELEMLFDNTPGDFPFNDYYNHANEPVHHIPYLFSYSEKPWLTQYWVRTILENAYDTTPYGIRGNEDVGQMSSWYILSAMGFHPICPGDNRYYFGSPLFREVVITLDGRYYKGLEFRISTINNDSDHAFIQKVLLNGKVLNRPFILHQEIVAGGTLVFEMGTEPNRELFKSYTENL